MYPATYLQPVAYHRFATDRLLLKDESESWYLWTGESAGLVQIEHALAQWIYRRPEIFPVSGPAMWFDIASLPAGSTSSTRLFD